MKLSPRTAIRRAWQRVLLEAAAATKLLLPITGEVAFKRRAKAPVGSTPARARIRTELLLGDTSRFEHKLVVIVGAGALGSRLIALARMFLVTLGFVDDDTVSASNTSRGTFTKADIGGLKALQMVKQLASLATGAVGEGYPVSFARFIKHNASRRPSLVIAVPDNDRARLDAAWWAASFEPPVPLILAGTNKQAGYVLATDLVSGPCPWCALDQLNGQPEEHTAQAPCGARADLSELASSRVVSRAIELLDGSKPSVALEQVFIEAPSAELAVASRSDCMHCGTSLAPAPSLAPPPLASEPTQQRSFEL